MKSIKMFCAAALVFGMGLGFSTPSEAVRAKCDMDMVCLGDCLGSGLDASICRRMCCA